MTQKPTGTGIGAVVGDISSHAQQAQSMSAAAMTEAGLPLQSSVGEEAAYVCTAASHEGEGEGEGMEGVPHYRATAVSTGNAGTMVPNDMHVSG